MKQMAFYDILQLDPAVLKVHIKQAETRAERRRFQWGLVFTSTVHCGFCGGVYCFS